MNMQKVGIVVQSISVPAKTLNPRQYRALNMTRYTLCEYQGQARRSNNRNGFAFDIPPILRLNPSTVGEPVFCLSGFGQSEARLDDTRRPALCT